MRLVAVGTGTVVPEGDRGGSSFYVEALASKVLLDCGPGTLQSLARLQLAWPAITDLVLTHFHADHIGALPSLFFALKHAILAPRTDPLSVWGPPGTVSLFSKLAAAFGGFVTDPGFPVHIRDLPSGARARTSAGVEIAVHQTAHTAESHAVRLDADGASIGYTGDTGLPEEEALRLGSFLGAMDLLIAECSLTDDAVGDNHLSPTRLANLAAVAGPSLLWITHVYPHVRAREDVRGLVAAAGYTGRTHLVADGDVWSRET